MFIRRRDHGHDRYTWLRVGLFFLAAGMWLGGVIVDNPTVRYAAIGVLVVAFAMRLAARRAGEPELDEVDDLYEVDEAEPED